jgi:hypothetical protein
MTIHMFDDDVCEDEIYRDFYHTQISYQSVLLKGCLADFKGTTAILLDCAFAGVDVMKGNQSLLAACGPEQAARDGPMSLTNNVIDVLREAAVKQRWVSWGGLHGTILLRSLRQNIIANTPIWQDNEHKREEDVSFMFKPMLGRDHEGTSAAPPARAQTSYKEWNSSLPVCSVILAAHVSFWHDAMTAELNRRMTLKPDDMDAFQSPVRAGVITNVLKEGHSTWIQVRIDGRVLHEMACHPGCYVR